MDLPLLELDLQLHYARPSFYDHDHLRLYKVVLVGRRHVVLSENMI
jgi:hypothetical protein